MSSLTAVTGAASGIGRGIAERLLSDGSDVVLLDRDADRLSDGARALECDYEVVDVTDTDGLRRAMDAVAERHGPLTGLVNSAGINLTGRSDSYPPDDWRRVVEINLTGTFLVSQAAYPVLADGASIVNITSTLATRGIGGRAAYSASKGGVNALTQVLAVEWAERGIRVNAIGPAWTRTELLDQLAARGAIDIPSLEKRIPFGRLGTVEDVTGAVAFLLSDAARFVTGQVIYVDGGYVAAG